MNEQHTNPHMVLIVFVAGVFVVTIPVGVMAADLSTMVFMPESIADQMIQVLVLAAVLCLVVMAVAVLISQAVGLYFIREIARERALAQAYNRVREEFEWKSKLYHHKRHHPSLPSMEVDTGIQKIQPFVPLKRPVKRGDRREAG